MLAIEQIECGNCVRAISSEEKVKKKMAIEGVELFIDSVEYFYDLFN